MHPMPGPPCYWNSLEYLAAADHEAGRPSNSRRSRLSTLSAARLRSGTASACRTEVSRYDTRLAGNGDERFAAAEVFRALVTLGDAVGGYADVGAGKLLAARASAADRSLHRSQKAAPRHRRARSFRAPRWS